MKFKSLFLGLFFVLLSTLTADTFIQEATYTMGDDDSKLTAKNKAILIAKREAIEQAGVQITSYSKSVQGLLKDDVIESFSSSLMKITILDKKFNYPNYWVKIKADIDIKLLNKKLKQFSNSGVNVDDQISSNQNDIESLNKKMNLLIKQKNKRNELKNLQEKKKRLIKKVNNLANNKAIDLNIIKNANYGYITVTSNVKDAEIYIDGKYVGYAPIKRFKVLSGKDIELKAVSDKRYYPNDAIEEININSLTTPTFKMELNKGKSEIFLVGDNANLYINDIFQKTLNSDNKVITVEADSKLKIGIAKNKLGAIIIKDIYANNTYEIQYSLKEVNIHDQSQLANFVYSNHKTEGFLLSSKNYIENAPINIFNTINTYSWYIMYPIYLAIGWFIILAWPLSILIAVLYGVSYSIINLLCYLFL